MEVILFVIESIKNDDLDNLKRGLDLMPLENLRDKRDVLLVNLLAHCAQYNRPEAARMVVSRWEDVYPQNDKISILSRIFMISSMNLPTLAFLVTCYPDFTYVELMQELCQWDGSPEVVTAVNKAESIYGAQSYEIYEILKNQADEQQNYAVYNYMVAKMVETAPFAPIPPYVGNYLSHLFPSGLPSEEQLKNLAEEEDKKKESAVDFDEIIERITIDQAVQILTEGMENEGLSIGGEVEAAKSFLKTELSKNNNLKKELLLPVLKTQQQWLLNKDTILFLIYGPANPLVGQDLNLGNAKYLESEMAQNYKYGGCRMLLCNLFDYNFEDDYLEDWFDGSCDYCLKRIKHRWYSLRVPRPHGGWENCVCSFECMRGFVAAREAETQEPEILTHELIDLYEEKITRIGIQDRV